MQHGKIVASGTPLRLKSKFGNGYRLTLASSSDAQNLTPPAESAVLESCAAGQTIWRLGDPGELGIVVKWADETENRNKRADQADGGTSGEVSIHGWGISMPSLEDAILEKKLF